MRCHVAWLPALGLLACDPHPHDTAQPDDTGASEASMGLPEGTSTWSGSMEVSGFSFLFDVEITNTGGDLSATATFSDDPEAPAGIGSGTFTLQGTHAPESGLVALAPTAWITPPDVEVELVGVLGTYDPTDDSFYGTVADWASGSDNTLTGGPLQMSMVSGEGEPTPVGDRARDLGEGDHAFTGTLQCTGPLRDVAGTLSFDGKGSLTGFIQTGDPGLDTPLGTFEVQGVYNPTTGGITLIPGLWEDPDHSIVSYMIDGTYDPASGSFSGDQLTNVAACPADQWVASF